MKIAYSKKELPCDMKIIESVEALNVLILSAHSGDEVLACGGLVAHLAENVRHIKVVYFSDKLEIDDGKKADAEVMRTQESEAVNGLRVLGIHEVNFLRLKNIQSEGLDVRILEELKTNSWDLVLAPSKGDLSLDHNVINLALGKAMKRKLHYAPELLFYSLYGAPNPDLLFDIDPYFNQKIEAVRCHKSLLKLRDLEGAVIGLNSYYGKIFGVGNHAEAYCSK